MATFSDSQISTAAPQKKFLGVATQDLWLLFVAVVFPVHVWAIINILREIPSMLLRMSLWEIVAVISYALLFALLDSIVLFVGVTLLGLILPGRFFKDRFVAVGSMLALVTAVWLIIFNLNPAWFDQRQSVPLALWAISYVVVVAAAYIAIWRKPGVEAKVVNFVNRLTVLSSIYLFLDLISIIIVIIRNI
ncbi:MAG: hypothetical protein GY796_02320 [Chloroflexi bacterium]|nr:hypothetical protein [Chloroflexota bacterium]